MHIFCNIFRCRWLEEYLKYWNFQATPTVGPENKTGLRLLAHRTQPQAFQKLMDRVEPKKNSTSGYTSAEFWVMSAFVLFFFFFCIVYICISANKSSLHACHVFSFVLSVLMFVSLSHGSYPNYRFLRRTRQF